MGKRFILLCLVILGVASIAPTSSASAEEFNHTLTVSATVLPHRAIYLNETSEIIKVAGNTANNIEPVVYNSKNQLVDMSPSVKQQYDRFLSQHKNRLDAGETYVINPIAVDIKANDQVIKINTSGLTLGSAQSG